MLVDSFGRKIDYVRLSVTDRCNLRCYYCMPHNIQFAPKDDLLSYEEMLRLLSLLRSKGITKLRITGGEPLARKDILYFLKQVSTLGFEKLSMTSNGVLIEEHLDELISYGFRSINLSLDTFDKAKFERITRRNDFDKVSSALNAMLQRDIDLKMNTVVMKGINDDEIVDLASFSLENNISVRFIEEMPFDGRSESEGRNFLSYKDILSQLEAAYPGLERMSAQKSSTSMDFKVPGSSGSIGIIAAHSRTFCSSCNRIRITSFGELKGCLYESGGLSLRDIMRQHPQDDRVLSETIDQAIRSKYKDGFVAEKESYKGGLKQSMSIIGG